MTKPPSKPERLTKNSHPRGGRTNKINIAPVRIDTKTTPREKSLPKRAPKE